MGEKETVENGELDVAQALAEAEALEEDADSDKMSIVLTIVSLAVFSALIQPLGFLISSFIYMVLQSFILTLKEERKKKREVKKGSSFGFSIGGEASGSYSSSGRMERSGGFGSFGRVDGPPSTTGGFKISGSDGFAAGDEDEPGRVHFNGSLRMQAIRKSQAQNRTENDEN